MVHHPIDMSGNFALCRFKSREHRRKQIAASGNHLDDRVERLWRLQWRDTKTDELEHEGCSKMRKARPPPPPPPDDEKDTECAER